MPILLKDVHHTYAPGTPWARPVLRGVNLEVPPGECLGILGRIGSGKSTLLAYLAYEHARQGENPFFLDLSLLAPGEGLREMVTRVLADYGLEASSSTVDYLRELVTIKGRNLDLGAFPEGAQAVEITVRIGTDERAVRVRMVRKGKSLKY